MKPEKHITHRSPTPPPTQVHHDKRRAPRSRDRQQVRNWRDE